MAFNNLLLDLNTGILKITINRPDKLNALNFETMSELRQAASDFYDNDEIKAVIITGAGEKSFVAGADINEIASIGETNARKVAENGQETFALLENSHKPVIAAVNGYALGGGCELAMACHMRVASENAKFGQPEVNLGIIPGYGGTQRLTQMVGRGKAIELMLTADMIDAHEAKSLGLVNHVVPAGDVISKSEEILRKIMEKPPLQVGMSIDCANAVFRKDEDGYHTEANAFARSTQLDDFKEGTAAFLEKRKANFEGK